MILNCSGKSLNVDNSESKFKDAIELFNNEKYTKARDAFESIIISNPGTYSAIESLYYLAESLFKLENYHEASSIYSEYITMSEDSQLIDYSRFLICKCRYLLSADYTKDQDETKYTIEIIQNYLDENPNSSYSKECEDMIYQLRLKLAKKELEAGRLYLRIEKYDTIYYDEALLNIIITHILRKEFQEAELFLENNKSSFLSNEKYMECSKIIEDSKNGLKLKNYFKLLK